MVTLRNLSILRNFSTRLNSNGSFSRHLSSIIAQPQVESGGSPWKLRRCVVPACLGRWDARPLGIDFDVAYVDTGADWHYTRKNSSPVVFAVHGMPSDHNDILPVVSPLHDIGCRVIGINLPGFELTKACQSEEEALFQHSTGEITEFMLNFLQSMRVNKVDLLVAHSAGVLPSVVLSGMTDIVRSLLFICSFPGHQIPKSALPKLVALNKFVVKMYGTGLGRLILKPIVRTLNNATVKFRGEPDHFVNVLKYVTNANFSLLVSMAQELEIKQVPYVYALSRNDPVMEFKGNMEWAEYLGFDESQMDEYDADYKLCKKALLESSLYRKGVIFQRGGHYPYLKTETALPILIQEAKNLLQFVSDDNTSSEQKGNAKSKL